MTNQTYTGPASAWKTIWETIALDSESAAFDPELRSQIVTARQAIEGGEWGGIVFRLDYGPFADVVAHVDNFLFGS